MLDVKWRCRDGVRLVLAATGELWLAVDGHSAVALNVPAAAARHVHKLNEGLSDTALAAVAHDDVEGMARLFRFKNRLQRDGLLVADLCWQQRRLAVVRPRSPAFDIAVPRPSTAVVAWRFSRFALLRRDGDGLVLESTDAACDVAIDDGELVRWIHETVTGSVPPPDPARTAVLGLLALLGFLDPPDHAEPGPQRMWEFHDRLFHRRSRIYDDFRPLGATFRFRGADSGARERVACPPAIRPGYNGDTIELPVPNTAASRPLVDVMESRRSRRNMGERPVGLEQVSALLYRVARVTATPPEGGLLRPFPSSGALHELEFYVAVRTCGGLAPGYYHYRSEAHALTRLPGDNASRAAADTAVDCAVSWGEPESPPQCVIVVSSRLPRLAWKYSAIAYRLSLLNAGVVLQSLYLVATDLGLHGAAAGSGRSTHLAHAAGLSTWEETSIVEFGFGSGPGGHGG